jgi:predicted ATPase
VLTSLRIQNFRGFQSLDTSVAPVTAFLGPNSSGKTTVLHAVRLACEAVATALESDEVASHKDGWVNLANGLLVRDHSKLLSISEWQALFVDKRVGENTSFSVQLDFSPGDPVEEVVVKVICARNEQLKMDVRVRSPMALQEVAGLSKKSAQINERLTGFLRQRHPRAVFIPPFYGTIRDEEYRSRAVLDRLLRAGDQSHVVRNLVSGLSPEQFSQLNIFLQNLCNAELTYRTAGDQLQDEYPLRLLFQDSNGPVEISSAGAGLINLIALYASLARWQRETPKRTLLYLLDEPEAHLHSRLQAESADQLSHLLTTQFKAQLLLATHSVDILNRLSQTGALLVRVDRGNVAQSSVDLQSRSSLFEELSGWVDLTPYSAINAFARRRVVFVEDESDAEVIQRCARFLFRNNPFFQHRFDEWAFVPLNGAGNAPISMFLGKLVSSHLIAESTTPFRILTILDKDSKRQSGSATAALPAVEEEVFVWSRYSIESLFLESPILERLIRLAVPAVASLPLGDAIEKALREADVNLDLNDEARSLRLNALLLAGRDRSDSGIKGALQQATDEVRTEPATWQKGKDRFRVVMTIIRGELQLNLPVRLGALLRRIDVNQIADARLLVPTDVREVLDRMVVETLDPVEVVDARGSVSKK